jgi:excinuclease ABC subunit C
VRNRYRKYRLKEHGGDDYAAMREVITRRLVDSIDGKAPFMDLLLIDGGRNQLAVAVDVIKELGVEDKLEVASLAKRLEEVFLPDREEPVILEKTNAGLLLLQRARDETHAASNKFQQKVASKILRKDYLDDVEGLGEKRKQLLLDKIGGWRGLEDANFEQLESIQAIPKKVREKVWDLLEERRAATNKTE